MQRKNLLFIFFVAFFAATAFSQKYKSTKHPEISKTLGDSEFSSSKTIFENLKEAPDFTILAKILDESQVRETLEKQEMVTIFAIADEAFLNLTEERRDSILGNRRLVNSMIQYLAVPGRIDSNGLHVAVEKNFGKAQLTTVEGQSLEIKKVGDTIVLVDNYKNTAKIIAPDFYHKNGFFHIIDGFVFPPGSK
ncbi:MAG: hypothetical protein CL526_10180 [Aequorivita sp.]|nr:hypothetical protein [Aequorivita sp.]|tara:strand:- start:75194 stop:75772 length:579 start_codon:yes stop_codon:yes gene_type:complete